MTRHGDDDDGLMMHTEADDDEAEDSRRSPVALRKSLAARNAGSAAAVVSTGPVKRPAANALDGQYAAAAARTDNYFMSHQQPTSTLQVPLNTSIEQQSEEASLVNRTTGGMPVSQSSRRRFAA